MPYKIHLPFVLIHHVQHVILPFFHTERGGTVGNLLLLTNDFSSTQEQLMFMNGKLIIFTKKGNSQK